MSTPTDNADLIRERLLTAPAGNELATLVDLTHIETIIHRQQNGLKTAIATAVDKGMGAAILIQWQGFETIDENSGRPRIGETYNVAVWSKKVLDAGQRPAELVLKSIVLRLWHWIPQGGHVLGEAKVRNGGVVGSDSYLINDCEVVIPTTL